MKKLVAVVCGLLIGGSVAYAEKDLDSEVTDIKLRVSSGAKSKFSSSFTFDYAGASVNNPTDDERPTIGSSRRQSYVGMRGSLGLRYRKNKNESIFVASGFSQTRPFHTTANEDQERLEVSTPYLGYNNTLSVNDWQLGSNVRLYVATEKDDRKFGQVATLGYSLSSINNLGQSKWSGGVTMDAYVVGYDKHDQYLQYRQNDYGISVMPRLQYNKSGRVHAYTLLNMINYTHYRIDPTFEMKSGKMTQTLGLGAALRRDFYLTPYMAFEPEKITADKTSVNVSATINL